MKELIEMLHRGDYSCVIRNSLQTRTFTHRGVIDLYNLLKEDANFLKGASVADKVIGKAAAALTILGGVKEVYAEIISLPALILLRDAEIDVDFQTTVPFIRNRNGDAWCPLESTCYQEETAKDILPRIESFLANLSKEKKTENR